MNKYQILSSRHDVPESILTSFQARSDKEAIEQFDKVAKKPENSWNDLNLERIDVVEKKTFIKGN